LKALVAVALAALLTFAAMKLRAAPSMREFQAVVLAPGVFVCQWFLSPRFSTPTGRLWIVAVVNTLLYWPGFLLVVDLLPDWRRLRQAVTLMNVLSAVCLGAAASALSYMLDSARPKIFGILMVPAMDVLWPVSRIIPQSWWKALNFLKLMGGLVGYSAIAFLLMCRFVWRRPKA
jgi:hypothetical protein